MCVLQWANESGSIGREGARRKASLMILWSAFVTAIVFATLSAACISFCVVLYSDSLIANRVYVTSIIIKENLMAIAVSINPVLYTIFFSNFRTTILTFCKRCTRKWQGQTLIRRQSTIHTFKFRYSRASSDVATTRA